MRLLIDLQGCQNGSRHRGIGRYSLSLAKALLRNAGRHEILLLLNGLFEDTIAPLRREFEGLIDSSRILVFHAPGPVSELKAENAWRQQAAELLREAMIAELAPDALLVSSMVEGAMDDSVTSVGWLSGPTVVGAVLYDLIPLLDPERYIGWAPARSWYFSKMDAFRRCDLLLAISASAKAEAEDALQIEPRRVVNISTAADEIFENARVAAADLEATRKRFGISRPYLMHSGNIEPRKNFQGLIKAFGTLPAALRQRHQLVLVGKFSAEARTDLESVADLAGLQPGDLVLTGHVTDDELIALYAGCHLFVFPSLHEGFGLPALEAMHFGVPAIGSNTSSVPEVIGREDATFDPTSTRDMATLITRCLTDAAFHAELKLHARRHARTFSWDTCARHALLAFEQALLDRDLSAPTLPRARRERLIFNQMVIAPEGPKASASDLVAAAQSMAWNEAELMRMSAHAANGGALTWRVEGPFDSSYSLALVNREAARALEAYGHQVALHSTEGPGDFEASPSFLSANPDLAQMHGRVPAYGHASCDIVSRNLYPPRVADLAGRLNLLHQYAWEEGGFPSEWVADFNQYLHGITCTSSHVLKVLLDNGVRIPMAVVGNGVDHWERIEPATDRRFPGKCFRFLHVSSCFPRKGADVMLAAYGDVFSSADDVSLLIKTFPNPHNDIHERIAVCRAANPRYPDVHVIEDDLPDPELKALYQHCQVLVAPSRAEGFGLPLAEAMLSGLPVITTNWGGQLDFCSEQSAWLVDYSFARTQTHFGLFGSVWAEPDRGSLSEAMRRARATSPGERLVKSERGRNLLLANYRWSDVTARAIAAARQWSEGQHVRAPAPRIGWVTTWNTKCGIASYSRHLIESGGEPVTVLAPRQDGRVRDDERFVERCWTAGKGDNQFADLSQALDRHRAEVLIVQFNYGFFNLHALAAFLNNQVDAGRTVLVTMHSTGDPPELAAGDTNWRLVTTAPALARCHRLLAHTLADLNRLKQLGLATNAMLFPHPLWDLPASRAPVKLKEAAPLVATFGYCLPHKGLPEVLEAAGVLRDRGTPIRLRMLNAEYPDQSSAGLAQQLRQQIRTLKLERLVELRTEYLSDGDAAALLSDADLLVFPYQNTQESASGAIRHALATTRPVAVTPIHIFDELGEAVFRFTAVGVPAIADGVASTLRQLRDRTAEAVAIERAAGGWRDAHGVARLSRRLLDICRARTFERPSESQVFDGSSRMLRLGVGQIVRRSVMTTGQAGVLLHGPYAALRAGRYAVKLTGLHSATEAGAAYVDIAVDAGRQVLIRQDLVPSGLEGEIAFLAFDVREGCNDLEVRIFVDERTSMRVDEVRLWPAERSASESTSSPESRSRIAEAA